MSVAPPTVEDFAIIEHEERLLTDVLEALREVAGKRPRSIPAVGRLTTLRDQLRSATPSDLPALRDQLHRERAIASRGLQELPDPEVPYFAHMRLEIHGRERDVLLGHRSYIDSRRQVQIVDWRGAPIASVFFRYREGEEFEVELPDRTIEGTLLQRRILSLVRGRLMEVSAPSRRLRRDEAGNWWREEEVSVPELSGGEGGGLVGKILGTGQSGRRGPVIAALLDERQYDAVTREPGRPLLVLGSAGCGKTTVAIHRLAYLAETQPEAEMIAIVPEEGLVRLTKSLLEELGLEHIPAMTIDEWFTTQGRKLFPELPRRLATDTPAAAIRFKRHPAMLELLARIAEMAGRACASRIDRELYTGDAFASLYEASSGANPLARLEEAARTIGRARPNLDEAELASVCRKEFARFERVDEDRLHLLGDRALFDAAVESSGGSLFASDVDLMIERARIQFSPRSEEEFVGASAADLRTSDGLSIDDGTPMGDAGSIDIEDFPLLLRLAQLKTGRAATAHGRLATYHHLMLDEAQELSTIELSVLGHAIAQGGSVTVAGDPAQQIDESLHFPGWDAVVEALGVGPAAPVVLETSYRCTAPIAEFGQRVLGSLAPVIPPVAKKPGPPVTITRVRNEMHGVALLAEALQALGAREPFAHVALLARAPERAQSLYDALPEDLPTRLVLAGEFSFEPGIDVTTVQQVKGLEFDYVIVVDASARTYPDDSLSRRTLHVAATRAIHQLWVIAAGSPSPLLPAAPALATGGVDGR